MLQFLHGTNCLNRKKKSIYLPENIYYHNDQSAFIHQFLEKHIYDLKKNTHMYKPYIPSLLNMGLSINKIYL